MFTILNRLRGTYSWWPKINAAILCLVTLLTYENPYIGFAVAFGYIAGESMGWGDWIGGILTGNNNCGDEGSKNGIKWLASKFAPCGSNIYNHVALTLRGFWWWIPTLSPLYFVTDATAVSLSIVALGVLFPVSIDIARTHKDVNQWELAEYIYGFFQDIVLLSLFLGHFLIG